MRNSIAIILFSIHVLLFLFLKSDLWIESLLHLFLAIHPFTLRLFSLSYTSSELFTYGAKLILPQQICTFISIIKQINVFCEEASGSGHKKSQSNEVSLWSHVPWFSLYKQKLILQFHSSWVLWVLPNKRWKAFCKWPEPYKSVVSNPVFK